MSIISLYGLFVLLPNFNCLVGFIIWGCVLLCLILGFCSIGNFIDKEKDLLNISLKYLKRSVITLLVSALIFTVIPTEKQIYMIAGGYVVTNNQELQKLPNNVLQAANKYLERLSKYSDEKTTPESK